MFYGTELAALDNQPLFYLLNRISGGQADGIPLDKISYSQVAFSTWSDSLWFLVLNQFFDKRWKAYIDGEEVSINKANRHFMGFDVPGGQHKVRFVFVDRVFTAALFVSGITVASIVGVFIVRIRRRHILQVGQAQL